MRTTARAHYVGHNAVTRVPRHYIYLDTEARREVSGRREVQTFRLAVAAFDAPNRHRDGWRDREWCEASDTATLWEWVTGHCRRKTRTVLVAHNLSYDLRISDAFTELPRLGWTFKAGRVDDGQAWFVWTSEGRTLAMVDTLSWVPTSLERLGELVGLRKVELPEDDDADDRWWARCTRDVEILAEVWRRLMRWVETDDLGNWKLSGAGQSWAAYRHRFMTYPLLVHEDDDARAAERHAAHTGRCEAWRHGKLSAGPYTEWDFHCAYATIGADSLVPTKLCGEIRNPNLVSVLAAAAHRAVLIECEVTTDVPTAPCRTVDGIGWPVGTFDTTVWDNEMESALAGGADVVVRRAWIYRRTPALRDFCSWVLDGLDDSRGDVDAVVRVALKHWSRALIGRTAARWSRWEPYGFSPAPTVALSKVHELPTDETWSLLQLGHQLVRQVGAPDNPDAMGAIMSWVMAESRVRLWAAMRAAGLDRVVYVDTDSLIVDEAGSRALASAAIPGLRVKGRWHELEVLGPRQLIPGRRLRAAGIPRDAVQVAPATWEGEVWSGLSRSLRAGQVDSVEVARRRFVLRGTDNRREHLAGGLTAPFRLSARAVGERVSA